MLINAPQIKVFVKLCGKQGNNIVLACFVVARHDSGHVEILKTFYKTVSEREYNASKNVQEVFSTEPILALYGKIQKVVHETLRSTFEKVSVSPYIDFSFFVSQPTRAPSLV